jgi:hypothetical protein
MILGDIISNILEEETVILTATMTPPPKSGGKTAIYSTPAQTEMKLESPSPITSPKLLEEVIGVENTNSAVVAKSWILWKDTLFSPMLKFLGSDGDEVLSSSELAEEDETIAAASTSSNAEENRHVEISNSLVLVSVEESYEEVVEEEAIEEEEDEEDEEETMRVPEFDPYLFIKHLPPYISGLIELQLHH